MNNKMVFCSECGKKLSGGEKYCSSCGKKTAADSLNEARPSSKLLLAAGLGIAVILLLVLFNPLASVTTPISDYLKSEVLSTSKNCGNDLECFKKVASVCSKAFVYYDFKPFGDGGENASIYLETLGFEDSECLVYSKVLDVPAVFSQARGLDMQCRVNAFNASLSSTNCFGPLADYMNEYTVLWDLVSQSVV